MLQLIPNVRIIFGIHCVNLDDGLIVIFAAEMVKPRERKTTRGQIPQEVYEEAAEQVNKHNFSIRNAAKTYNICHVSLTRFMKALKRNEAPRFGYRPHNKVFSNEQEVQLVEYCKESAKLYYGLSTKDLRRLSFQFAIANNCKIPEQWDLVDSATENWLTNFLKRNPELSIRTPESTSLSRAMNFNKQNVGKFFNNLSFQI